jgi:O-antigen/teichoic acid export membrane protein
MTSPLQRLAGFGAEGFGPLRLQVAVNAGANTLNKAKGLLLILVISHGLGLSALGVWTQVQVLTSVAAVVAGAGMFNGLVRFYPRREEPERRALVWTGTYVVLGSSIVAGVLAFALAPVEAELFAGGVQGENAFRVGAVLVPAVALELLLRNVARAQGLLGRFAWTSIVRDILELGLVAVLVHGYHSTAAALVGSAVAALGSSVLLSIINRSAFGAPMRPRAVGMLLRYSLPIVPTQLGDETLARGDRLLVGALLGPGAAGLYSAIYALASVTNIVNSAFTNVLFPAAVRSQAAPVQMLRRGAFVYVVIATAQLVALALAANPLVHLMTGEPRNGFLAPAVLALAGAGIVLFGLGRILSLHLYVAGRTVAVAFIWGGAAALNVILNLALIPLFGLRGAALSTLLSYGLFLLVQVWLFPTSSRRAQHIPRRSLEAAAVVATPACSALALGLLITRTPDDLIPVVLGTVMLALTAAPFVYAGIRQHFDPLEPIHVIMIFLALQLPLQAYYIVFFRNYDQQLLPHARWVQLLDEAMLLGILGTLAFIVGYYAPRELTRRWAGRLPSFAPSWDSPTLGVVIVLYSAIGLLAFAFFMDRVGGASYFWENLYLHNALARGHHYLLWGFQFLSLATFLWFAHLCARSRRVVLRPLLVGHFLLVTLFTLTLGGRANVLYVWEVLIVLYHYLVRPLRLRFFVVFAVAGALFLGVTGQYRQSTQPGAKPFSPAQAVEPTRLVDQIFQYDYSPLDVFVLLLDRVPDQLDLRWGASFLDIVQLPVPRAVYPGKPPALGTWYGQQLFGADRGGKKASIFGEGYVNFSIPGIVLVLFLHGLLARTAYEFLRRSPRNPSTVLVYALLYKFVWSWTGGGFGEIGADLLTRLIPVLLALSFVTGGFGAFRSRSGDGRPAPAPAQGLLGRPS